MANEYLKRTPTSTGNRKVWTWSGWVKINKDFGSSDYNTVWSVAAGVSANNSDRFHLYHYSDGRWVTTGTSSFSSIFTGPGGSAAHSRDPGSWIHICLSVDTTKSIKDEYQKFWINGIKYNYDDLGNIADNANLAINNIGFEHYIGNRNSNVTRTFDGEMFDLYLVDGQALTPDVFGKYDEGKGYISAGTSQATDFKKGQWIPKAPAIIKSVINARGGFGVNGFYLPMNSSNNFGADFHCTPNSILKLKEDLPQPKAEIDGVGDYTGALRDDPFKNYLVLAIPGVSGGLQNGFGDYSAAIRGSGSPKTVTSIGNAGVSATSSYYGSALSFDGNGDCFSIPNSSDFSISGDFTVEFWCLVSARPSVVEVLVGHWIGGGSSRNFAIYHYADGDVRGFINLSGTNYFSNTGSNGLKLGQWNHLAFVKKGNQIQLFLNGVGQSLTDVSGSANNSSAVLFIGAEDDGTGSPTIYTFQSQSYIQDFRIYKGVAKYTGGFDVPKPYTPVGIETWRAVPDTCQNNFATLNSVEVIGSTGSGINKVLLNGNLTATTNGNPVVATRGNFPVSSGKWYFEATNESALGNTTQNDGIGVVAPGAAGVNGTTLGGYAIVYRDGGGAFLGNESSRSDPAAGTHATYVAGDIIGVALDIDNRDVEFFKNGVSVATYSFPSHIGTDEEWVSETLLRQVDALIHHNFGQNPTFSGNTTAGTFTDSNGKGLFKYEPPTGFLALCEDNLPTPAIKNPGEHFKTILYTGDNSEGRSITGVGFKPDLIWFKARNVAVSHVLNDTVRGVTAHLNSNTTTAESIPAYPYLNSVDSDGFSLRGGTSSGGNISGRDMVAWCWKAGGPAVTNTDGSITSQVSANQTAGFSIVSWTAANPDGRNTLGHGLGKTPKFIMAKSRTSGIDHWVCYHNSLGKDKYILLSSTSGAASSSNYWSTAEPDSATFGVVEGISSSNNTGNMIAYCWAEIEGFSKFGSYVGNDSTDGPFVYCGFKPAFVLLKASSTSGNWCMTDNARNPTNPTYYFAVANFANAGDDTGGLIDFVSNGFKLRLQSPNFNGNGVTYIFAAFAESAFSYSNAK